MRKITTFVNDYFDLHARCFFNCLILIRPFVVPSVQSESSRITSRQPQHGMTIVAVIKKSLNDIIRIRIAKFQLVRSFAVLLTVVLFY